MSTISDTKYDLRKNPFTEEWDDGLPHPTAEEHTIPAASPFHITLEEAPKYEDPSTVFIYLTDTLNGDVLIGAGTITVTHGAYWAVDDILKIDDEYLLITGIVGNDLAVTRGYGDSDAAAHDDGTQFKNMGANETVQADPLITGVDKFTEKTTTPSQGEFEVHYGTSEVPYKRGLIRFHEDDAEKIVWVQYYKTGHYNYAEHINDLQYRLVTETLWVSQGKLKTAIGSVSGSTVLQINLTLPGGQYGFYPQVKMYSVGSQPWKATILKYDENFFGWTSYITNIALGGYATANCVMAQQRYISASSRTHWIFLLYNKNLKQIVAGYEAPDHPSYGNGGDEEKVPHPFADYIGKKLPDNLQIILLDNSKLDEIKAKMSRNKGLLEITSEEYKIDFRSKPTYKARDIYEIDEFDDLKGEVVKILEKGIIKEVDGKMLKVKKAKTLKKRTVSKLPDYILYKSLKKKQEK